MNTTLLSTSMNSPFRYPGGKHYARSLILPQLPQHLVYCEPFCGGASIFFARPRAVSNWLNDLDPDVINCLTMIRDRVEDLIAALPAVVTRALHQTFKTQRPTDRLARAVRWFYLNRTSYSGIVTPQGCYFSYSPRHSMRPENWPAHLRRCSAKLRGVRLTTLDFDEVIDSVPSGTLLFVDPPYFAARQETLYARPFVPDDHDRLARVLHRNRRRIRFLLSYDNVPEIPRLYWWTSITEQSWCYMLDRTDDQRTGRRRSDGHVGNRTRGRELFIRN